MVLRWCAISPIARASYIPLAYCRIYDKAVPCLFRINFCWSVLASVGNPAYECLNLVVLSARDSDLATPVRVSIAPSHTIQPRYRLGDSPAFRQALSPCSGTAEISAIGMDLDPELLKSTSASLCGLVVDRMKKPAIAGRLLVRSLPAMAGCRLRLLSWREPKRRENRAAWRGHGEQPPHHRVL